MIQPNELRIGNLFHEIYRDAEVHLPDTSRVFEITSVPSFGVEAVLLGEIPAQVEHHHIIMFYNLSPIPLTEDWLLKLGFNMNYSSGVKKKYFHHSLLYSGGNALAYVIYSKTAEKNGVLFWGNEVPKIHYIHQLQNLFFALTNKELEIKQ